MIRKIAFLITLVVLSAVVASCAQNSDVPASTQSAVLRALGSSASTGVQSVTAKISPRYMEIGTSSAVTDSIACSGGGAMEVSGTTEDASSGGGSHYELHIHYAACQITDPVTSQVFTVNGEIELDVEGIPGSFQGTFQGEFESITGVELTCAFTVTVAESSGTFDFAGQFCGRDVDEIEAEAESQS